MAGHEEEGARCEIIRSMALRRQWVHSDGSSARITTAAHLHRRCAPLCHDGQRRAHQAGCGHIRQLGDCPQQHAELLALEAIQLGLCGRQA
jgi:hypothetical protein